MKRLPIYPAPLTTDLADNVSIRSTPIVKICVDNTYTPVLYRIADYFKIDRNLAACTLCELFCTFFLMYGGTSLATTGVISGTDFKYSTPIGWGLWLTFVIYIGFNISGAHLNPALTFMFYFVYGQVTLKRFFCYAIAQFSGFFLGSALTFLIYYEGLNAFDGGVREIDGPNGTAGIFATYPKDYLSITGGFIDQVLTTAVLVFKVLGITDKKNRIPRQFQPLLLGISLWTIVAFWSQNCGAALNPARDFGPRLFTFVAGWGWKVFSYRNYRWFLVPLTAPMFGAILGAYSYNFIIGDYLEDCAKNIKTAPSLLPLFDTNIKPMDETIEDKKHATRISTALGKITNIDLNRTPKIAPTIFANDHI